MSQPGGGSAGVRLTHQPQLYIARVARLLCSRGRAERLLPQPAGLECSSEKADLRLNWCAGAAVSSLLSLFRLSRLFVISDLRHSSVDGAAEQSGTLGSLSGGAEVGFCACG